MAYALIIHLGYGFNLYGDARAHTIQPNQYLNGKNIEFMDLNYNLILFPFVKNKLRGQKFSTSEKAVDAFKMYVLEIL